LVVKNGSNTRAATSGAIPQPVSRTVMTASSPSRPVRIVIFPRSPESPTTSSIACAALTIRLRNTWLISSASDVGQITKRQLHVGDVLVDVRRHHEMLSSASPRSTGDIVPLAGNAWTSFSYRASAPSSSRLWTSSRSSRVAA
jgi:hypothetical protein